MTLEKYQEKRKFTKSPEPKGRVSKKQTGDLIFVVQKHKATRLHYDLRLEHEGILKSWAIPKKPSLKIGEKRLATLVEDHPLEYASFEGVIPEGNYGAGTVKIWDSGTYYIENHPERIESERNFSGDFKKGELRIIFNGRKLKGKYLLIKFKPKKNGESYWLFFKAKKKRIQIPKEEIAKKIKKTMKPDISSPNVGEARRGSNPSPSVGEARRGSNPSPSVGEVRWGIPKPPLNPLLNRRGNTLSFQERLGEVFSSFLNRIQNTTPNPSYIGGERIYHSSPSVVASNPSPNVGEARRGSNPSPSVGEVRWGIPKPPLNPLLNRRGNTLSFQERARVRFFSPPAKGRFPLYGGQTEGVISHSFGKRPDKFGPVHDKKSLAETLSKLSAKKAKIFHNVKPMLASLVKEPFDNNNWFFEIKFDGYRAIAEVENRKVRLYSRNNLDLGAKFLPIIESLQKIPFSLILDGEIIVQNEKGRSDFNLLRNYERDKKGKLVFFVFDILHFSDYDLRDLPLEKRKEILKNILPKLPNIKYTDHIVGKGKEFFKLAKKEKLEGIIAKLRASTYETGKRSMNWQKIKVSKMIKTVIIGYTEPFKGRKYFGSLILGLPKNGKLKYIGNVGTGFDEKMLKNIFEKLEKIRMAKSPFRIKLRLKRRIYWVKPRYFCKIKFTEWTNDGRLRQPVFIKLL